MTKTEKRLEKQLTSLLTNACNTLKNELPQFCYLSHTASLKKLNTTLLVQLFCSQSLSATQLQTATQVLNTHLSALNCTLKATQLKITLLD
ncbi:hypothetical protein PSECIP111951_00041 [Pseudoalteromonas holothuriae]|uniref:Orphan protein n=1 Tax=Pseudoalteromonas holothuriae TaxID=2963714 RepID=A0A9W4QTZ1_9GAMM|nr:MULTISPECIES: hypothetical protein [unclassified Pseudoalteromonas]CAH9049812.1 hypothetical protein PSECIP111951_00041 [Pseudoalteromonas sp. CIP111951]CAH9052977.1 hypothetical protein PSECIP111854_01079 [Pseudoalteromonas sp. CIP111854]